jgi:hypothetical protein
VNKLIHNDVFLKTEEEQDAAIELLEANVPDPNVMDYIFWHEPIDKVVDPCEVVDRAMAYKPIRLGPLV